MFALSQGRWKRQLRHLIKARLFGFNLAFSLFFFSVAAESSIPKKELQEAMGTQLTKLQSAQAWKTFATSKKQFFPLDIKGSYVTVDKMDVDLHGESFTVGVSYRQFFMKTSMERAKKIMNSPSLWKNLYGLDADSTVGE